MQRSNFTIADIMLVTIVVAIFLSSGVMWFHQKEQLFHGIQPFMVLRVLSGAIVGATIGFGLGLSWRFRILGTIIGVLCGGVMGGLAAAILSLPQNLMTAIVGSSILLTFGLVVRFSSNRTTKSDEEFPDNK
jgi:hypothetical protein